MVLQPLRSWLPRSARPKKRSPIRNRRPICLERLEERLAPAIDMLDVAGVRFLATNGFTEDEGGGYVADNGFVAIGYTPVTGENFLALIQADIRGQMSQGAKLFLDTSPTDPSFALTNAKLNVVVVGGSPGVPIPIWQTPDEINPVNFDIGQLTGNGVTLNPADSIPIEVAKVDFTLTELIIANPNGPSTIDAEVKMQGTASFANVPLVNKLNLEAEVEGEDYVVADSGGIILTGLEVTKNLPTDASVAGLALSGSVTIGYNHTANEFSFEGDVSLSSKTQDTGQQGLKNLTAGLQLTVSTGAVTSLGFTVGGSFTIFDLTVSTLDGNPFSFEYDLTDEQYELQGGLKLQFRGNEIEADFNNDNAPGIIIVDGVLTQMYATIIADFKLFEAEVATDPSLTFEYQRATATTPSQFIMYGGLTLTVSSTAITAVLGNENNPGLVIKNGELAALNLGISATFSIFSLEVLVNDANIAWTAGVTPAQDLLTISGDFEVNFKAFSIDLKLGSDSNPDGLVIQNGEFQVEGITVEMKNAQFGAFTVEDLKVQWAKDGDSFDLDIVLMLAIPGGFTVGGTMDFEDGKLNDISLSFQSTEGIAVGDTGLFLTEIDASVQNIENPSQLIVSGDVAFTFGETFSIASTEVKLFRVEGKFTVDANELILEADAQLFAYSVDSGATWQGLLGEGDAKLTLDWGDGLYALHVEVDGLAVFFDLTADLTFAVGKDIRFLAEVDVVVPEVVPFIGGDKLGGFGFFFDHTFAAPITTTLAAWIELHIIWDIEVGFEVVYPGGHVSLIGAGTIDGFKKEAQPPVEQTYTYTADFASLVPANATYATLLADWSQPAAGVTIVGRPTFRIEHKVGNQTFTYTEAEFTAANGLALIPDPNFNTDSSKALQAVGSSADRYAPLQGDYKLLVDVVSEGGNPFPNFGKTGTFPDDLLIQATYHIPKPIFGTTNDTTPYVPAVPAAPPGGTFTVTLQGNMDESFLAGNQAKVSLYRVLVQDPQQRAVLVGSAAPTQVTGDGFNWQAAIDVPIDGLYPLEYVLYAVVTDGFNVPVKTGLSVPFTPAFAVQGGVSNQLDDALTGWGVYLDYNQNGMHDPNEPITQTSSPDGFYAFAPSFDPSTGWSPVPVSTPTVSKPFNVQLIVPSGQFLAQQNPVTITFDGTDTKVVDFAVQERTAIKGLVFADAGNNGNPADGTPLPGATVYLDTNGNGTRDSGEPTQQTGNDGTFAFRGQGTNPLAAGTYTVGLDVNAQTPAASYVVPAGTVGNESEALALGMTFTLTGAIDVTSLGVFDSGGDGFQTTLTATLYDQVTQQAVATLTFTPGDPGTLVGGSRFKALAQPITLYAGFQGVIVAEGFTTQDPWGGAGTNPAWTTNGGANQLTFTGTGLSGPPGQYPTGVGVNAVPNPYAAGTFLFRNPVRLQTSPSGIYVVTLDNSGFDVKEGNDFGVQAFASVSGTVTGQARTDGVLSPTATPQSGVTVNLLQNGAVVGNTTTGNAGQYSFAGLRPGAYTVEQVVPTDYRQTTPFNSDLSLQTPGAADVWQVPDGYAPVNAAVADFNNDGVVEYAVLVTDTSGQGRDAIVYFFYNGQHNAPGTTLTTGVTGGNAVKIVAGNLVGSGRKDLMVLYDDGALSLLVNLNGDIQPGNFAGLLPLGVTYSDLVTGNFFSAVSDRDHLAALFADNDGNSGVVAYSVNGNLVETTGLGNPVSNLATGDINGDGSTDLFAARLADSPIVLLSNGGGAFMETTIDLPGTDSQPPPAIGDINGDGLLDLGIFLFTTDPENGFFYTIQNTTGGFPEIFAITLPIGGPTPQFGLLADVNGDFRPDLVLYSGASSITSLLVSLNTGVQGAWFTHTTTWQLAGGTDSLPAALATGDFDADGFLDLVIANTGSQASPTQNIVQFVRNTSTILPPAQIPVTLTPALIATGVNFNNGQLPGTTDVALAMPSDTGAGDWTVRVNGNRLEVRDSDFGLWSSRPLSDLRSLTIIAADGRPNRVTLDLTDLPLRLRGGVAFQGSTGADDTLRILLGAADDVVAIVGTVANVNNQLAVSWTNLDRLTVDTGAGDDTLSVRGTPLVKVVIPRKGRGTSPGSGVITLNGGVGDDTYVLATQASHLRVEDNSGVNTLDFRGAAAGVKVDLRRDRGQTQSIGGGNLLALTGAIDRLYGSAYNDVLTAGQRNSILVGGDGDDVLSAFGQGRHLLLGGAGRDVLFSGAGRQSGNVLIGGSTIFDTNPEALDALLAEWSSARPLGVRIANLTNGSGSRCRSNGDYFLNANTLVDDGVADLLIGNSGQDWFLAFSGDRILGPKQKR